MDTEFGRETILVLPPKLMLRLVDMDMMLIQYEDSEIPTGIVDLVKTLCLQLWCNLSNLFEDQLGG